MFEIGETYMFKGEAGTIKLRFIEDGADNYYKCEIRGGSMVTSEEIGTIKQVWKRSRVLNNYEHSRITEKTKTGDIDDPYGRNVRINYKNPELLDVYIDMALQTGDKRWFNQLVKAKKEVSAS